MNNEPVDICIPFVDSSDPKWIDLASRYAVPISPKRYRSYDTLRYELRGIEKFMPWVRNIFIVVQSESQIPKWLNTNHPKIKVIFHRDFIPAEYLPVFKSSTIELHFYNIPGISNNFILSNDDIIPIKPTDRSDFFTGNSPVTYVFKEKSEVNHDDTHIFRNCLYRMSILEKIYLGDPEFKGITGAHTMEAYNRDFFESIVKHFKFVLRASFIESKMRLVCDINHYLVRDLQYAKGLSTIVKVDDQDSGYIGLTDDTKLTKLLKVLNSKARLICLNDSIDKKYEEQSKMVKDFLDSILNEKSDFEI